MENVALLLWTYSWCQKFDSTSCTFLEISMAAVVDDNVAQRGTSASEYRLHSVIDRRCLGIARQLVSLLPMCTFVPGCMRWWPELFSWCFWTVGEGGMYVSNQILLRGMNFTDHKLRLTVILLIVVFLISVPHLYSLYPGCTSQYGTLSC